eukprot:gene23061-30250_t
MLEAASGGHKLEAAASRAVCAKAALSVGKAVQRAVHAIPYHKRGERVPSAIKPPPNMSALADLVGEEEAFKVLAHLADELDCEVRVVVDPSSGLYRGVPPMTEATEAGDPEKPRAVYRYLYCYLDAVDGTVKVGGLNNERGRLRAANDGSWAVGIAFTDVIEGRSSEPLTEIMALQLGDFKVSAIIDGALTLQPHALSYPAVAVAIWEDGVDGSHGRFVTRDGQYDVKEGGSVFGRQVFTSTNEVLSQSFAYLDSFQAFDRTSAQKGDEKLATELYAQLINRTIIIRYVGMKVGHLMSFDPTPTLQH